MKSKKPKIRIPAEEMFTGGAFVRPECVEKDGRKMWCWVVSEFMDDSYWNGMYIEPRELAKTRDGLIDVEWTLSIWNN